MTVLELAQGHYADLTGMAWDDAIQMFRRDDERHQVKAEPVSTYHYQCWHEREVENGATAPWGYEWYHEDEHGLLKLHSAHYDSSG